MEKHPLHIKIPELQTSPDVGKAVKRQERLSGERVPNDPSARIEAYMDRLGNVFLHPDEKKRERNLEMLRPKIYDALLIKKQNFPESYFELQQRIARERGQAVEEIPPHVRDQMMDVAIEDQKASLDAWIDYLTSNDAVYPTWFKYFVWRNITKLSQFDKERGEFKKRTDSTVAPFPDIYYEPLAQIADLYEKVKADNKQLKEAEVREAFSKKFPALYAELIQKSLAASLERKEETKGKWIKYDQNDEQAAERLFSSLEGKGTGWCTAGRSTARTQIDSGDFYVYYTNDKDGQPTQPRLAIRMEGTDKIGEVRGILPHQGVEPLLQDVLDTKLEGFGKEADTYRKKSADMKQLTVIDEKSKAGTALSKDDLIFLYEIHSKIEGFGYQRDPRIDELRKTRNVEVDMPVIFDCEKKQIARNPKEVNEFTKAYVGPLFKDIFQKLAHVEHVYTSFPDGKITQQSLEIGGPTKDQLEQALERAGFKISDYARSMMKNKDFTTAKRKEQNDLVRLTVDALFNDGKVHTTDEIYAKAKDFGLELCPAEVGPHLRLSYQDQPLGEWVYIAMKQITDSDRRPGVFLVARDEGGSWLDDSWAIPGNEWDPEYRFVFRLRK
ncbi:MAG: hypothetical protein RL235_233 [Chlamydiota bacterium]|jgi:hypothetical protein